MKITVSVKPRHASERDFILRSLPDLPGKHSVPIPELLSNLFLLNVNCVRPQEFHEQYTKLDDDDHAGLDDLANTYTSIPTFVELMHRATADWVVGQLKEQGISSHAKIKESVAAGSRRAEFKLPDGIQAITEDESRALLGNSQTISADALQKLIQEGKAYEETFQLWGSHVVVLYVRYDDGSIRTLLIRDNGQVANRLHYFLPPRQAALVYFFEIDVDLKDAEKAKAAITAPDIKRTPLRIADAINQVETDPTRIIDLIREFVDANISGEGKEIANAILDFVALIPPEHVTLILDFLQLMLDIVGMFPGAGEPADLANAAISAKRGQILDAALSAASAIPAVGNIPGLGKALWRLKTIFDLVTNLPTSLRGLLLDLLNGIQEELLSFTISKIPDLVRALKRRITDAAQKLRLLSKKADNVPSPTTASHFTPPSSIGKNPSPSKMQEVGIPQAKSQSHGDLLSNQSSKPRSHSEAAETPPLRQSTPAPKKEQPAPNTKQGRKTKPRSETRKDKVRKQQKKQRNKNKKRKREKRDNAKRKRRASVTPPGPSGMGVVRRPNMPERTRLIKGKKRTRYGGSKSSSTTKGHDQTIEREANKMLESGKYDYVTMQRSWGTATGRITKKRSIPDLIGARLDGRVDAFEVKSRRDKPEDLMDRLKKGMYSLPLDRRGRYSVIESRPNRRHSSNFEGEIKSSASKRKRKSKRTNRPRRKRK